MQRNENGGTCWFGGFRARLGYSLVALPAIAAVGAAVAPQASAATRFVDSTGVVQRAGAPASTQAAVTALAKPTRAEKLKAYFAAGYDYQDAVRLARYWANGTTPFRAKVRTGGLVINPGKFGVPFGPKATPWTVSQDVALGTFFNNGYDVNEAIFLAEQWHMTNLSNVKVRAGRKILAGIKLPVPA
jgi:hypothetical protein